MSAMRGPRPSAPQPVELDALDRGIVEALRKDGRMNNSALAAELGVAEGTVRQRIKKLLDTGAFRVAGMLDPELLPDHQLCVIGLKVDESRQLEQRAHDVAALPEVRSVAIVTGRYDLLVEVLVSSNQGLIRFLSESLAEVPGITSSETFLLLKTYDKWV
jgi:Lrp/AsnC family transcriptional regulator, regulator for asnA, asnC and gidA